MDVQEQPTLTDSFLTYLKERIDSPFFLSFIVSWCVINRDFCFYLIFKDEPNKHYVLSNWNFGSDFFNLFYSIHASSLWYPIFYAFTISVLFTPLSLIASTCRYLASASPQSWAKQSKSRFELVNDIKTAERKLKELNESVASIEKNQEKRTAALLALHEKIRASKAHISHQNSYIILEFLIDSIDSYTYFSKNISEFELLETNDVATNSLVSYTISDIGGEVQRFIDIPIHQLMSDQTIFEIDKEATIMLLSRIIVSSSGSSFSFDSHMNRRELTFIGVKNYSRKTDKLVVL